MPGKMQRFRVNLVQFFKLQRDLVMQKQSVKQLSIDSKTVLKEICQITNFSYGEIWLPDRENDFLQLSSDYYVVDNRDRPDLELFYECSQGFIMSKGEGLPGRVFSSKKPEWMLDVSIESESSFLRNKIAAICGVKTGFAIPIIEEEIVMIMAFFTCELRCYSSKCLALAMQCANNLIK